RTPDPGPEGAVQGRPCRGAGRAGHYQGHQGSVRQGAVRVQGPGQGVRAAVGADLPRPAGNVGGGTGEKEIAGHTFLIVQPAGPPDEVSSGGPFHFRFRPDYFLNASPSVATPQLSLTTAIGAGECCGRRESILRTSDRCYQKGYPS